MGIHKRYLYSAKHHLTVASESDGSFPAFAFHRDDARRTHITQTVKDIVFQFWIDETRVSPNKKYVCSKRLARCSYVKYPIHLLEEPQVIDIFLQHFLLVLQLITATTLCFYTSFYQCYTYPCLLCLNHFDTFVQLVLVFCTTRTTLKSGESILYWSLIVSEPLLKFDQQF